MKRKVLSYILAAVMVIGMIPFTVLPASAGTAEFKGVTIDYGSASRETAENGDIILSYKNVGEDTLTIPEGCTVIADILVVGGGGAGGYGTTGTTNPGGGGGGGQVLTAEDNMLTAGSYTIIVGSGGAATTSTGNNGSPSSVKKNETTLYMALGGGGGGAKAAGKGGETVATGGGGGGSGKAGGVGALGETYKGGNAVSGSYSGGGGGAGGAGGNSSTSKAGDGGAGVLSSITGTAIEYGGGGGGGQSASADKSKAGSGNGGGGVGGYRDTAGENGTPGLGGGGGGGGSRSAGKSGGAGGSGVVVIRIKEPNFLFIKSPSGTVYKKGYDKETFDLGVSVSDMKDSFCREHFGTNGDLLQLYYNDVLLSDDEMLSSYGIKLGDTLEFEMLPRDSVVDNGMAYKGTETAELFPDNKLEILIENDVDGNNIINDGNVLYIGTADSYQQSNINELANTCDVRYHIFSQSEDGYYAESEYDITSVPSVLTQKGEMVQNISYPAAGTADTVATKFVYALYKELIENINDRTELYDKIFLSFNGDLADGINGEDDCLNVTKYADSLGESITGKTDNQILDELKYVLDFLYSEGRIVWLTPDSFYGTDGYTSESTGNFANCVLGGYGYKNPVQIPQTGSEVFKNFFFGQYETLLVDDTFETGLTVKEIIPQIKEDGVWYDIPAEGYTESLSGKVIKATAESLNGASQIKVLFDIAAYREWAYNRDSCSQPPLRVKLVCEASDEFIQTYTAEEHSDFDNTICTYEGVIDDCLYESFEFHIDSPEIKTAAEEIHSHGVECPDCGETVCDPTLTKCPKCGADLDDIAMDFTVWDKTDSLPDTPGNYFLTEDVTLSQTWNVPEGETNLCLNGCAISITDWVSAVYVGEGVTFNLFDCNTETVHNGYLDENGLWYLGTPQNGETVKDITGGVITSTSENKADGGSGSAVCVENGGSFTMNGGTFAGNYSDGAGIYVESYGTFTMNGGTIAYNKGFNSGAVFVGYGCEFIMNGGTIAYNTAENNGGGVFISTGGEGGGFTMNGGTIAHNTAELGGGVFIDMDSDFTMNGGSITANTAIGGGGLYVEGAPARINGGEITANTADYDGAGITVCSGSVVTLSGKTVIKGNTKDGKPADIINYDSLLILENPEQGMCIGLCDGATVNGASAGDEEYFFASAYGKYIKYNNGSLSVADILSANNGAKVNNSYICNIPLKASGFTDYIKAADGFELQFSTESPVTGTVVTVLKDGAIQCLFTVVIKGDVAADGVCDVLDVVECERTVNGHTELEGAYFMAADCNADAEITDEDYSAMVNLALAE